MITTGENGKPPQSRPAKAAPGDLSLTKLLDRDAAVARLGGDERLYGELVGFFREDIPPLVKALRTSLDANDAAGVRSSAHALKGQAANIGATRVVEAAAQLEDAGRTKNLGAANTIFGRLTQALDELTHILPS